MLSHQLGHEGIASVDSLSTIEAERVRYGLLEVGGISGSEGAVVGHAGAWQAKENE